MKSILPWRKKAPTLLHKGTESNIPSRGYVSLIFGGWCGGDQTLYRFLVVLALVITTLGILMVVASVYYADSCRLTQVLLFLKISGAATVTYFLLAVALFLLWYCEGSATNYEEYCTVDKIVEVVIYFSYAVVLCELAILICGSVFVGSSVSQWDSDDPARTTYCPRTPMLSAGIALAVKWGIVVLFILHIACNSIGKCLNRLE